MDISPLFVPRTAPAILFENAERYGDAIRFLAPAPISWREYAEEVRRLGCCLLDLGVAAGDCVAIYAHNSLQWASASLAIQSIGAILVPIYPASTLAQRDYILEHSDARFYFSADGLVDVGAADQVGAVDQVGAADQVGAVDQVGAAGHLSWEAARERGQGQRGLFEARLAALDLRDPALMLYTSGTTGMPKGVPLSHANIAHNATDWLRCNEPALHEDAVDLLWLPMSHIFGFGELCLGNTLGFTTHLLSPAEVLERMPTLSPTVFMSVPAYWEKLAGQAGRHSDPKRELLRLTGGKLRFCLSGGAGLKREVKELFLEIGCLIIEGYGLSECAPTLTLNRPGDYNFDSVGKALPSVELRIAEDAEIQARGPNIFSGYHKNAEATAEAFTADGWFRTGDLGRLDDEGFLSIIGRKKEILVTAGGKNIPPANIEMLFQDDPYVEHVVVYGDGKKYLVAAIWPNLSTIEDDQGGSLSKEALHQILEKRVEQVNQRLARFETIKHYAVMDSPLSVENELLTASLKIRRNKIYERHRTTFEDLYARPQGVRV